MAKLWLLAMVGALVAEYVAMYVFPKHYAKLAFIPFLSREEPLMRRLVAAAYRDATPSALTVGELGLEGLRHDDPRLVRLVTPFHDDLDEPAFRRLRRTIRDQTRSLERSNWKVPES